MATTRVFDLNEIKDWVEREILKDYKEGKLMTDNERYKLLLSIQHIESATEYMAMKINEMTQTVAKLQKLCEARKCTDESGNTPN